MRNDLHACCAHGGEAGTGESERVDWEELKNGPSTHVDQDTNARHDGMQQLRVLLVVVVVSERATCS